MIDDNNLKHKKKNESCDHARCENPNKLITMITPPRIFVALALAGAVVSANVQAADSKTYFNLDGGISELQDVKLDNILGTSVSAKLKTKTGFGFNAVGGVKLNDFFALELESGYQQNDLSSINITAAGVGYNLPVSGNISVVPVLANAVLSGKITESVSVNIGGGLGIAISNFSTSSVTLPGAGTYNTNSSETKTSLMGQIKTGIDFKLTDSMYADLGYRLRIIDGPNYDGVKTKTVLSHMFTVGVGFKF
jgi:opacity protein-like surface antigen